MSISFSMERAGKDFPHAPLKVMKNGSVLSVPKMSDPI
jgi:hypothetical protein